MPNDDKCHKKIQIWLGGKSERLGISPNVITFRRLFKMSLENLTRFLHGLACRSGSTTAAQ